jgi:phospholipid transport system transporter-binding protein
MSEPAALQASGSPLTEQQPGSWLLTGDINFNTVVGLRQAGINAIGQGHPVCRFDFAGVGSVNTMALSLILCWLRAAKQVGVELQLSHIPSELRAIAELSDLQSLTEPG